MEAGFIIAVAVLLLAMIPFVPKFQELRIASLRAIGLRAFGDWHERHHKGLVLGARIAMVIISIVLFVVGFSRL